MRLAYAGSPGKKDYLRYVVNGIERINASQERVVLDVLGTPPNTLLSLLERDGLPSWIRSHGLVSQKEALDIVSQAHYVPLLRPNRRSSNAGFPTKVVEGFAVGTPVITNATSDLQKHVLHGVTGWLVSDPSSDGFAEALLAPLSQDVKAYRTMRLAARHHAERAFDFRTYTDALSSFVLESCSHRRHA